MSRIINTPIQAARTVATAPRAANNILVTNSNQIIGSQMSDIVSTSAQVANSLDTDFRTTNNALRTNTNQARTSRLSNTSNFPPVTTETSVHNINPTRPSANAVNMLDIDIRRIKTIFDKVVVTDRSSRLSG